MGYICPEFMSHQKIIKMIIRLSLIVNSILLFTITCLSQNIPVVEAYQLVTENSGGFSGNNLDNSDLFGSGITEIGDLDGDGVVDLAVGARKDDDGGTDRGAVWILFMKTDGTVDSYQKISDTQGGFTGTLANSDHFGMDVANLGDIDGDDITDLAVGAWWDDDGGTNRGAVWILFMNTDGTVDSHQKISDTDGSFTGTLDNDDQFGISVGAIGDVNGDGTNDLAVGAPKDDDGGTDHGAVWILHLRTDGTVKDHQKISDTEGSFSATLDDTDYFGIGVDGVGDINGDGYNDIAVSAYYDDDGGTNKGAVYLLLLDDNSSVNTYQKLSDPFFGSTYSLNDEDYFGRSVKNLGDIDNDGVNDLIVGASGDDYSDTDGGAVHIITLNQDGTLKAMRKIAQSLSWAASNSKIAGYDYFGTSATSLGDLDGNGTIDMAISLPFYSGSNQGAFYVFEMGLLENETLQSTVKSYSKISDYSGGFTGTLDDNDYFGQSTANIGDINGDGIEDLAVGATGDDDGGTDRGAVYVLTMNADGTVNDSQKISDTEGNFTGTLDNSDYFGRSIAGLGDFDGNGVVDIAVGAHKDDDGGTDRGAVWILYMDTLNGGDSITVDSILKISDTQGGFTGTLDNNDKFGMKVANIGDVDDDGVIDIAVGSAFDDDGGTDRGAVWILFMNSNGTVSSHQKISDTQGNFTLTLADNAQFGYSVTGLGDIDDDGIPDIFVGEPGYQTKGRGVTLRLNSDGTVKNHTQVDLNDIVSGLVHLGDRFGTDVASLGNVDGDALFNIAITAQSDDDPVDNYVSSGAKDKGSVWIVKINTSGAISSYKNISNSNGNFYAPLEHTDARFGSSVACIGDLNNDGYKDIIVGQATGDDGGTNRGAAYYVSLYNATSSKAKYANLRKKLDGSYYITDDRKIYFRYEEEYNASSLTYNIYDYKNEIVLDEQDLALTKAYGENRFIIDLTGSDYCLPYGIYVLEVINDKNEKWYLRFREDWNTCAGGVGSNPLGQ
jgi:hypothetical protein